MKKRNPLRMIPEGTNRSRPSRPRHEWSPTSKALDPFTGVCFESKDHATVRMFLHKCRCVLEADAWAPERGTSLAKVTLGCGPLQFSRGNATRHKVGTRRNPKAFHHNNPQGRRQEEAFGREELSSWNPNDAQSPSDGVWTIQLNGWDAPAPEGLCG